LDDIVRAVRTVALPLLIAIILLGIGMRACGRRTPAAESPRVSTQPAPPPRSLPVDARLPDGLREEYAIYLLGNEPQFRDPRTEKVAKTTPTTDIQVLRALTDLGYVQTTRAGEAFRVTVTDQGRLHIDHLMEDDTSYTVPVATRAIARITASSPDAQNAGSYDVRFTWRYQPNAIGSRMGMTDKLEAGAAVLTRNQGSWYVTRMRDPSS
jgi:hypothetical protein